MTKGLVSQNKYEYKIELINSINPDQSVKRQYCSTFEIGECWGYNQFQPLDQLVAKDFVQENTLLFQIGIRNRTYRSLVAEKEFYIEHLKNQLKLKQEGKYEIDQEEREEM